MKRFYRAAAMLACCAASIQPAITAYAQTSSVTVQTAQTYHYTPAELNRLAQAALADYNYHSAAHWAHLLKQQTGTLPPHLQQVLAEYGPPHEITCTSCGFGLSERDLADLIKKGERGDKKAAARLAGYYAFDANDMDKFEYWNQKAGSE